LAKPAQRALANAGVTSLQQLSNYSEKEIADLHGMGPNALTKIKQALLENSLSFADK
jgi:DNA-directed RNA polymerase alpha subunit